jgi:dCMP deaminase
MDKETKYDNLFMDISYRIAEMSFCKRSKVGASLVKDNRVVVNSWNGTISGVDNCCEDETNEPCEHCEGKGYFEIPGVMSFDCDKCHGAGKKLVSKNTVVHAEANALMFAARNGIETEGCKLYVTLSPCIECSKLIIQAGIKRVIYAEDYRITDGVDFLRKHGVKVVKLEG